MPAGAHRTAALPAEAELAIVGGGIMGLAIAYQLAERGLSDVVVLEGGYLAGGASGRNGGGVRQQWGTDLHIRLMRESLELCRGFASTIGTNVWMREGGYLFLARSHAQHARMKKTVAVQNACGLDTRLIEPDEAARIVPELDTQGIVGACYNPTDAIVFPWPFLWGYAHAAEARGVRIHTFTPVEGIDRGNDGAFTLRTPKGRLRTRRIVNAAGAWSPAIAAMVGVELPTWPSRHEILSTEALKPFLRPMVSVLDTGLYFSQSMRGEIVGGITMPEPEGPAEPPRDRTVNMGSRLAFVERLATAIVETLPRLGRVRVVRQWAGPYDMSPDGGPIVGEAPGVPGFYLCAGFVGHGFMMAPVVARYYASHLTGGPTHEIFTRWRLGRFADGDIETEELNIG